MKTRIVMLHTRGPALWPAHKPLAEVLALKDTTQELVWSGTYQGRPTPPGGYTFKRDHFLHTRYHLRQQANAPLGHVYARYQSWDTALKDDEGNAYTALVTGELMRDYTLRIVFAWRARPEFDTLPEEITARARAANQDGKLHAVIVEDKASGISALQTLRAAGTDVGPPGIYTPLSNLLVAFNAPGLDKEQRANQAAVWTKNGSVWLPYPDNDVLWLPDFEDELFTFPQSRFKDYTDAFSQLVIYLENILATGYQGRIGVANAYDEVR